MNIKTITTNGLEFMVQSYSKNDSCHIVSVAERHSVSMSLSKLEVTGGYGKQDSEWSSFCNKLDIKNIKTELEKVF